MVNTRPRSNTLRTRRVLTQSPAQAGQSAAPGEGKHVGSPAQCSPGSMKCPAPAECSAIFLSLRAEVALAGRTFGWNTHGAPRAPKSSRGRAEEATLAWHIAKVLLAPTGKLRSLRPGPPAAAVRSGAHPGLEVLRPHVDLTPENVACYSDIDPVENAVLRALKTLRCQGTCD